MPSRAFAASTFGLLGALGGSRLRQPPAAGEPEAMALIARRQAPPLGRAPALRSPVVVRDDRRNMTRRDSSERLFAPRLREIVTKPEWRADARLVSPGGDAQLARLTVQPSAVWAAPRASTTARRSGSPRARRLRP